MVTAVKLTLFVLGLTLEIEVGRVNIYIEREVDRLGGGGSFFFTFLEGMEEF